MGNGRDNLLLTQLHRGDVLKRRPALDAPLKEVHPYFHSGPENLYFMVLTQSCGLVKRPVPEAECIAEARDRDQSLRENSMLV